MKLLEKGKKVWNEHKEKIIVGGIVIGTGIIIYSKSKNGNHVESNYESTHKFVDKDIFTNVALLVEDMLLEEGVNEGFIERKYNITWPNNHKKIKKMEIHIKSI